MGKGNFEVNRNKFFYYEINFVYMLFLKFQKKFVDQVCGLSYLKESVVSFKIFVGY